MKVDGLLAGTYYAWKVTAWDTGWCRENTAYMQEQLGEQGEETNQQVWAASFARAEESIPGHTGDAAVEK